MLTQIIAGDSLLQLGRKVHDVRALCCIPQYCGCPMSKDIPHKSTNGICKVIIILNYIQPWYNLGFTGGLAGTLL